jgi:hypothetical protein
MTLFIWICCKKLYNTSKKRDILVNNVLNFTKATILFSWGLYPAAEHLSSPRLRFSFLCNVLSIVVCPFVLFLLAVVFVCPSSIYGIWLRLSYLQTFLIFLYRGEFLWGAMPIKGNPYSLLIFYPHPKFVVYVYFILLSLFTTR